MSWLWAHSTSRNSLALSMGASSYTRSRRSDEHAIKQLSVELLHNPVTSALNDLARFILWPFSQLCTATLPFIVPMYNFRSRWSKHTLVILGAMSRKCLTTLPEDESQNFTSSPYAATNAVMVSLYTTEVRVGLIRFFGTGANKCNFASAPINQGISSWPSPSSLGTERRPSAEGVKCTWPPLCPPKDFAANVCRQRSVSTIAESTRASHHLNTPFTSTENTNEDSLCPTTRNTGNWWPP